jgi:hypothetical protein
MYTEIAIIIIIYDYKVKFSAAIQRAAQQFRFNAVVEIGPHPALAGPIRFVAHPSPLPILSQALLL